MDKMVSTANGNTTDTDPILDMMDDLHPTARLLVELTKSQDPAAGDHRPTSLVEIAAELLKVCQSRLADEINPPKHPDMLRDACAGSIEILNALAPPVDPNSSSYLKVLRWHSRVVAPLAVDAITSLIASEKPEIVHLRDINILDNTVYDDDYTVKALVFDGGPTRMENAKIALIQFQMMDRRILKEEEERTHIFGMITRIKATGCNTLLIPKSILITDLSLHYLAEAKIMVIKDVERDAIEYVTKTLNLLPIANIEHFSADNLGQAHLVEEASFGNGMILKITLLKDIGRTTSLLIRSFTQLVLCSLFLVG